MPLLPLTVANSLLIILCLVIGALYLLAAAQLTRALAVNLGMRLSRSQPRGCSTPAHHSANMVVNLLGTLVAPRRLRPALGDVMLPRPARFHYAVTETVLDRVLTPIFHWIGLAFSYIRRLQHGQLHIYVLYIFVTLFVLMIWTH